LSWSLSIAGHAPRWLLGDALRIEQILLNLVQNAIKFTERGGVKLTASGCVDGGVVFRVIDTGPGISAAQHERLFQRFEQADGPQRRSGSGLGLAICRELVAHMGGTLEIDSATGQGSVFRVALPLAESPPPESSQRGEVENVASAAGGPLRVLLVEDDATAATAISGLLQAQKHAVTHAANGLVALTELESAPFDVVLIDLDLPGVDGLTLARMIRAREAKDALPRRRLVGISARSRGDEDAQCRAAGMDAFVRKPVTGAMLAQVLTDSESARA